MTLRTYGWVPFFIRKYLYAWQNAKLQGSPDFIAVFYRGRYKSYLVPDNKDLALDSHVLKQALGHLGFDAKIRSRHGEEPVRTKTKQKS